MIWKLLKVGISAGTLGICGSGEGTIGILQDKDLMLMPIIPYIFPISISISSSV